MCNKLEILDTNIFIGASKTNGSQKEGKKNSIFVLIPCYFYQ